MSDFLAVQVSDLRADDGYDWEHAEHDMTPAPGAWVDDTPSPALWARLAAVADALRERENAADWAAEEAREATDGADLVDADTEHQADVSATESATYGAAYALLRDALPLPSRHADGAPVPTVDLQACEWCGSPILDRPVWATFESEVWRLYPACHCA